MAFGLRRWAGRKLHRGDLTMLAAIAHGNATASRHNSIDRLAQRHFVMQKSDGQFAVTWRGHMALMVRRK